MYQYLQNGMRFKVFVKEQNGTDSPKATDININKYLAPKPLTGEKAKEFYENIVKDSSLKKKESLKPNPIFKPQKKTIHTKLFKNSDLLWMAQNNDVKNLNLFFSQNQNYDVNITDDFGWTPLMCACCSGAVQAVEILLKNGADRFYCDRLKNNALTLAKHKNNKEVVKMLENFGVQLNKEEQVEEPPVDFFCLACKENFRMNKNKHESSTLHLFNCKIKTQTFYGIPESNKGFQLLLREGWNKEKGLGVDGKGRKFPIKAVMKKDRTGIGAPPPKNVSVKNEFTKNYENKRQKIYSRWKGSCAFALAGLVLINEKQSFQVLRIMENPGKSLKHLEEMENLGQEILTDRQEIIALDKRRNQTREGLRELKKINQEKSWCVLGPLLVKYPTKKIEEILKKDQVQVDSEINKLRSNLKVKVNNLRDMEHKPPVPGLMLKAMSPEEMKAVGQVLGRHVN